nr:hypothetical protein CFP56_22480 [Quercus suber]
MSEWEVSLALVRQWDAIFSASQPREWADILASSHPPASGSGQARHEQHDWLGDCGLWARHYLSVAPGRMCATAQPPHPASITSLERNRPHSFSSYSGAKPQASAVVPASGSTNHAQIPPSPSRPVAKPNPPTSDRFKLTPSNSAAGVKRKSEEPELVQKTKTIKTDLGGTPNRHGGVSSSRFQLSTKAKSTSTGAQRPNTAAVAAAATSSSVNPQRSLPKQPPKPGPATQLPPAGNGTAPKPKGFLSLLEQAKAAQEAAKAANAGGIKHKPVEKLTKRERARMMEEQKARANSAKKASDSTPVDCRGTDVAKAGLPSKKTAEPLSYQGTMKKRGAAPLAYKGTMGRESSGLPTAKAKQKGMGQDKYGGYASWSDLSDAEDEDEEDEFDSDDDMEAGFEDVGMEEEMALRAARKEDQEAQREEDRLRAEKAARKRKLQELSRKAAAGKRF